MQQHNVTLCFCILDRPCIIFRYNYVVVNFFYISGNFLFFLCVNFISIHYNPKTKEKEKLPEIKN